MLINNSAEEKDLGLVNGFGQSLASAARCIGPAVGGALWSLSVRSHFIFLNFIFVQFLLIGAAILGCYLPSSIDYGEGVNSTKDDQSAVEDGARLLEEGNEEEVENCGTP